MMEIILGSSSRFRRKVMDGMGLTYTTMSPDIDEKAITVGMGDRARSDPAELTLAIARAKAAALRPQIARPALLITSDQVAVYDGVVREKGEDAAEVRRFFADYNLTTPATVCAAVVVTNLATGKEVSGVDWAKQYFKPVPAEVVDQLIEQVSR